jgi:hypothetical protein
VTDRPRPASLSLWLYGAAFALLLIAAALLVAVVPDVLHGGRSYTRLLRISAGVSLGAAVLAVLALFLPRSASR